MPDTAGKTSYQIGINDVSGNGNVLCPELARDPKRRGANARPRCARSATAVSAAVSSGASAGFSVPI